MICDKSLDREHCRAILSVLFPDFPDSDFPVDFPMDLPAVIDLPADPRATDSVDFPRRKVVFEGGRRRDDGELVESDLLPVT